MENQNPNPEPGRLITDQASPHYGYYEVQPGDHQHRMGGHSMPADRCPAAHLEDPDPCDGPAVVKIVDQHNVGIDACEHHGARLLASLDGGRVYPLPDAPEGAAIRVFKAADITRPFPWVTSAPRTRADELSRAEVRARDLHPQTPEGPVA